MSTPESIVTSYANPDLDGVACAIAISQLEPGGWQARVTGRIDEETRMVLQALGLVEPPSLEDWSNVGNIWLVDTHHRRQLAKGLPNLRVSRITDHHTGGDPQWFSNAQIQNEPVGAAATLVAERYLRDPELLPGALAVLLQCAIASNTLDFKAPATSQRDREVSDALSAIQPLTIELRLAMNAARRGILELATTLLVRRDIKAFSTTQGLVVVGQLEAPGALDLLLRSDLVGALHDLATTEGASSVVLNLVDTALGHSALVVTNEVVERMLLSGLGIDASSSGVIRAPRILQRKTDVVPFLMGERS